MFTSFKSIFMFSHHIKSQFLSKNLPSKSIVHEYQGVQLEKRGKACNAETVCNAEKCDLLGKGTNCQK